MRVSVHARSCISYLFVTIAQLGAHAQHPRLFSDIFHRRAGRRSVYVCAHPMLAYASACVFTSCLSDRACMLVHDIKKMQVWSPRETKARERRRTLAVSSALPSVEEEQEEKRQPPRSFELSDAGAWRQHRARSCASSRSRACCGPGRCARMCVCVFTYLVETERKRTRAREFIRNNTP